MARLTMEAAGGVHRDGGIWQRGSGSGGRMEEAAGVRVGDSEETRERRRASMRGRERRKEIGEFGLPI